MASPDLFSSNFLVRVCTVYLSSLREKRRIIQMHYFFFVLYYYVWYLLPMFATNVTFKFLTLPTPSAILTKHSKHFSNV